MRIIAGDFRGRRLASLGKGDSAAQLRPTADRVRESLFSALQAGYNDPVTGATVLDLFAGTGALGLEALSRGASQVTFVESGRVAQGLIAQNIALCRAEDRTRLLRRDARRLGRNDGPKADLVFLDPPYGKGLGEVALTNAMAGEWLAPGALIVWEEGATIAPPEGVRLDHTRQYGDTAISILRLVAP
ncbi:16S rRNA (guanine(966)-N(2))-methyltransferase RsmD [Roseovarius sp. SCSIO 43702]|uniref:16S rRNA (guanine(966)-N(2))-methyltransferase RsmD n=1 Tax=Roseovarius sp. SCSIO 43702 TaxID=2823043 RepID=UPI001C7337F3|nr:16S rRNA (guanine(966)-N(2))-methyltransferase RsmD [Roseovarius sp. SCSIO 43702]QYX56740.1 16S rRNA (guanine(966)-N(2))-methyltransferase RsmD [Roseovarius sp. SCSIO 43702]